MIVAILLATPAWVWGLLVSLVGLGATQARPSVLTPRRLLVLPAVLFLLSLIGVITTFHGAAPALGAWAAGIAVAFAAGSAWMAPRGARWSAPEARLHLPGSWLPMVLILALFAIKYSVGVSLAISPALSADRSFGAVVGLAYGLFSGLFLARAAALWKLTRT